jgi:hypothetical protein
MLAAGLGVLALLIGSTFWMLEPGDGGQAMLAALRSDLPTFSSTAAPPTAGQAGPGAPRNAEDVSHPVRAPEPPPAKAVTPSADDLTVRSPAPPPAAGAVEPASSTPNAPQRERAAVSGNVAVQLATDNTEASAAYDWHRLQTRLPDLLGSRDPILSRTERGRRTFWLVRTNGFADTEQAAEFCRHVHARRFQCEVIAAE